MGRKPAREYDWAKIETEFRANLVSIKEVSRQNGIPFTTLMTRAERDGWTRVHNPDRIIRGVRTKPEHLVVQVTDPETGEVTEVPLTSVPRRKKSELRAMFDAVPDIPIEDLAKAGKSIVASLMAQLELVIKKPGEIYKVIIEETRFEPDPRVRAQMLDALGTASHIGTAKNLLAATKLIQDIETNAAPPQVRADRSVPKEKIAKAAPIGKKAEQRAAAQESAGAGGKFRRLAPPRLVASNE